MSDVTDINALIERLERLRTARKAFHAAREAMNAARPNQDVTKATRAEYAVYDERYQADQDARRMAQSEAEQFAMWLTESNVTEALRTLAERQPLGEGEVITRAARCGHHFKDDCQSCNSAIDWTNAEMDRLRAAIAALSQSPDVAAHGFRAITPKSSAHAAVLNDLARRIDDE